MKSRYKDIKPVSQKKFKHLKITYTHIKVKSHQNSFNTTVTEVKANLIKLHQYVQHLVY